MLRPDGSWDFTLYDKAFDAAGKTRGVKLFATLFPPTIELGDGRIQIPRSAHLLEIAIVRAVRRAHFRGIRPRHWVLQERTGDAGGAGPRRN